MKRSRLSRLTLLAVPFALTACVTINLYFPEKAVKDLSEAIEREVNAARDGEGAATPDPATTPVPGAHRVTPEEGAFAWFAATLDALIAVPTADAGEVAPTDVSNPAIRKIIESRRARLEEIDRWKEKGALGENREALLEVRSLDAVTDLRERAQIQRVLKEENQDREDLFREIAEAKKVDEAQRGKIRETYALTLREFARKGDWIQLPDGEWQRK